jgi:hypothetical protein
VSTLEGDTQPTRPRRLRRPVALVLPPALAVLGIVLLGANPVLGTAFIAAAVAGAASAAAVAVVRSRRR